MLLIKNMWYNPQRNYTTVKISSSIKTQKTAAMSMFKSNKPKIVKSSEIQ